MLAHHDAPSGSNLPQPVEPHASLTSYPPKVVRTPLQSCTRVSIVNRCLCRWLVLLVGALALAVGVPAAVAGSSPAHGGHSHHHRVVKAHHEHHRVRRVRRNRRRPRPFGPKPPTHLRAPRVRVPLSGLRVVTAALGVSVEKGDRWAVLGGHGRLGPG